MVISRTPLRVSLVGGGSDLPAFSAEHGGAAVSFAIDKYVYAVVSERFETGIRVSYSETEIVGSVSEIRHELVREALRATGIPRGVEIVTIADVPSRGSGLGSSSAVTIGVLNALFAYQGILKLPAELAAEAASIEIDVLGKNIGRQDQYACAFGGFQLLRFGPGAAVRRDPVVMPEHRRRELEDSLLMFYTGKQRASDEVLDQIGAAAAAGSAAHEHLAQMRDLALELYQKLGSDAPAELVGEYLHQNWVLKRRLADGVSDEQIDRWYDLARAAGAIGGKLLGAGGGGFLLFFVPHARQEAVRAALRELRELPIRMDHHGSRIISVGR